MIVERRIDLRRVLASVGRPLAELLAYDVLVTVFYVVAGQHWVGVESLPLALLGGALTVILGMRNNIAYARWWEARSLWGSVTNNTRSFARGCIAMLGRPEDAPHVESLITLQIAWSKALRFALLGQDPWNVMKASLPARTVARLRNAVNLPTQLQAETARVLAQAAAEGALCSIKLAALDYILSELANAQGGLEKIRNTPLPRQLDQFPRVFVVAYCLLLPIGLVAHLGALTPIGSTVIGFAMYVLDQIGRDLEDPFSGSWHDVPMAAITRTIENDLMQMLDQEARGPLAPVDGVLA